MKPALFLDRDGTLIEDKNYLNSLSDIKFFDDVPQTLKKLKNLGYFLIIVTNQSAVARGYIEEAFVHQTFDEMNRILESYQVQLDNQYYCPHYLLGEAPYNVECDCRKPKTGMIEAAIRAYQIDLRNSWVIGDKISDLQMAIRMGCQAGLVLTGKGKVERLKIKNTKKIEVFPEFANILEKIN